MKEIDFKTTNLQEKFQAEYLKLLEKKTKPNQTEPNQNTSQKWRQMCGGRQKEN